MSRKLLKDSLLSNLAAVNAMLETMPDDDLVGRLGFESRRDEIEANLIDLARGPDTLANIALMFHGKPVHGSRSINTDFAAKALDAYQDLVAKRLATTETGGLAQRGPIPAKQAAALNITGIARGSFGFILEEDDPDAPPFINSSLKEAVEKVTKVFESFTSEDEGVFSVAINEMDPRLFSSVKNFFKILHDDEATMRIVEDEHDSKFDAQAVDRAHQRCQEASIEEEAVTVTGTLIGVLPIGRRFEFKISDVETIKGKVGPVFSQDYLERVEKDEQFIGRRWQAKLLKKSVERPGQRTQHSYTLLELNLPSKD